MIMRHVGAIGLNQSGPQQPFHVTHMYRATCDNVGRERTHWVEPPSNLTLIAPKSIKPNPDRTQVER